MSNYFEGWYFKHQKKQETLAIIVGKAEDGAFIQVITDERSYKIRYPLNQYHKGKTISLADNHFARNGIRLAISNSDLELKGKLRYTNLTPINGDIMGPFQFLPMQCRHTVISMNHQLTGKVCLNGRDIDFSAGKGYIEGDAGRSFPQSYTWVHCNHFKSNCSIMMSVAHIPFALSWFWGCICVVNLEGVEYRLATYRGATIKERNENRLVISQKDLLLQVTFLTPPAGYLLDAPDRGRMGRSIREVPSAPARFELRQGNRILFKEESLFASYEHVL